MAFSEFTGASLSFVVALSWYFWKEHLPRTLAGSARLASICWPFFEQCQKVHQLTYSTLEFFVWAAMFFSITAAILFLRKSTVVIAWWMLFFLNLLKFLVLSSDFRFMGNYHYMPFLASVGFLFFRDKVKLLQLLLVLFYVAAGTLKVNAEWLTGAAVGPGFSWASQLVFQWGCAWVAIVELVFCWLLLSDRWSLRLFAFTQLFIFHLLSWQIVGYFYPLVMFALLLIFPLSWIYRDRWQFPSRAGSRFGLALFVVAQLIPYFSSVDPALDGRWRMTSLNMYDARSECLSDIFIYRKGGEVVEYSPRFNLSLRIQCDPIWMLSEMHRICLGALTDPDFVSADAFLTAKRVTDSKYVEILGQTNFCGQEKNVSRPWKIIYTAYALLIIPFILWKAELVKSKTLASFRSLPATLGPLIPVASVSNPTFTYRQNERRDGVAVGELLPLKIHRLWQSEPINRGIHGASKSSPAVDASGVYVGSDSAWFYHFDSHGNVVWKFHADDADRGIHGTALLDSERVIFGAYNGNLYCLRKTDGHLLWMTRLLDAIGTSPVANGNDLYVSAESRHLRGQIFKLKRDTGEVIWQSPLVPEQVHSSPTLNLERGSVTLGANDGRYYSFRMDTGALEWSVNLGGPIKGTGLLRNGILYVTSWGRNLVAINPSNGRKLWSASLPGRSQSSPVDVPGADVLVVSSHDVGSVNGVRPSDGKILWQIKAKEVEGMNSGVSVRAAKNGKYYVWTICEGTTLCALEPKTGKVLAKYELNQLLTGVPAIFDGKLYLALDKGSVSQWGI